jgi:hypothetical protein
MAYELAFTQASGPEIGRNYTPRIAGKPFLMGPFTVII